jgi:hypothetical protein
LESLFQYLGKLRADGARLPRRKGKPNKVVIARACGFSRHFLYFDQKLIQLLNDFDKDECLEAGVSSLTSVKVLEIYLRDIRDKGQSLPIKKDGSPNKLAIARAAGFCRSVFERFPETLRMVNAYPAVGATDGKRSGHGVISRASTTI